MERLPVELLYIVFFVGIVLFNILAQRAARRRQQEAQAQAEAQAEAAPAAEEPLEDIWGRSPAAPPVAAAPARPAAPRIAAESPAAPRVHPVRALLHERRDLRRAVALMMVLGPCRSEEPPQR